MTFSVYNAKGLRQFTGTAPRVRMQIFPIAADRTALDEFVDRWFNRGVPPEVAVFRAAVPLVMCSLLTYDDMSDADRVRTGIYAQNELYFLVVLERLRREGGQLRFIEYVVTTPHIFVDSPDSAAIGRDRYGFPKELCTFTSGVTPGRVPWASDARTLTAVRIHDAGRQASETAELIGIVSNVRKIEPGFDDASSRFVPPNPAGVQRDDVIWWVHSVLKEVAATRDAELGPFGPRLQPGWAALDGVLKVTAVNIRQMPNPSHPPSALYRDLVRFDMRLNRLQNVRLLSEDGSTAARPISIFIRRRSSFPIVEQLGLQISSRERRQDGAVGEVWDVVDPIAPLMLQGDITTGLNSRICWQTDNTGWHTERGFFRRRSAGAPGPALVDDYVGATTRIIANPKARPAALDLKYLILPAHAARLTKYLRDRIPPDCPLEFCPWELGGHVPVRLAVSKARPRQHVRGPLVWQDGTTVSVSIPVRYVVDGNEHNALFRILDAYDNPMAMLVGGTVYAGVHRFAGFPPSTYDWFTTTRRQRQHLVMTMAVRERESQETRIRPQRWLDIVSDDRPGRPEFAELEATFSSALARFQNTLHLGGIADPDPQGTWVQQRITLAEVASDVLTEACAPAPPRAYSVRFRSSDNLDLVRELGLVTEPDARLDPILTADYPPSLYEVVPAVGVVESAEQPRTQRVRILWSRHGAPP